MEMFKDAKDKRRLYLLILSVSLVLLIIIGHALADAPAKVPKTGQTTCYDAAGNVISCTGTGQDGDKQAGVTWPSPRFTDNNNGTITDHLTGLVWLKDANCFGQRAWTAALNDANTLANGNCGLSDGSQAGDWRLPNVKELESLVHAGVEHTAGWLASQGATNVGASEYWTSTTSSSSMANAWLVNLGGGGSGTSPKSTTYKVWPVRGGSGGTINLPQTGQTTCYDAAGNGIPCTGTGQDGDKQAGVTWPSPRFTDNNNGTVTDNLTGLVWLKEANCFGLRAWTAALNDANTLASGNCGLSDGSTAGQWRLPNIKELRSLVDHSKYNPPLPDGFPFTNVLSIYWSSTTFAGITAWSIFMGDGNYEAGSKSNTIYVWPVRSGTFYDLTISKTGSGTVTSSPLGINCGDFCTFSFLSGINVSLTATAGGGSYFAGWSDDCSSCGTNTTCAITMNAAKNCTAAFNTGNTLTVNKLGSGAGNVTAGTHCTLNWAGNTGTCTVATSTPITLSAAALANSTFTGWSGGTGSAGGCSGTSDCTFNITADSAINATFILNTYTVTANATGAGAGNVYSNVGGIYYIYPGTNTATTSPLNHGSNVVLTAAANSGSFVSWTTCTEVGGVVGGNTTIATCTFNNLTGNKTATATFSNTQHTLSVTKAGTGSGNVNATGCTLSWTDNTGTCSVASGGIITISGSAGANSLFAGFTGAGCAGASNCTINMDSDKYVTATFRTTGPGSLINIPKTGQGSSYDSNPLKRDDGALRTGAFWQTNRFITGDPPGAVKDTLTGLMWMAAGNTPTVGSCDGGQKMWTGALDYVKCLNDSNYLGFSDWRLPNVNEIASIYHAGVSINANWLNSNGFSNVPNSGWYWTSTTNTATTTSAIAITTDNGSFVSDAKTNENHVIAVRNSNYSNPIAQVPRTGQTTSYDATRHGEDGDIQAGAPFTVPRFEDEAGNSNLTVDKLTGLKWPKAADTPTVGSCTGGQMTWQGALNYVNCLNNTNYLGYSDWRLPNKNELRSLMSYGNVNAALPTGHPFTGAQNAVYWTSTTLHPNMSNAYTVNFSTGLLSNVVKTSNRYVLPVRGGSVSVTVSVTGNGVVKTPDSVINCGSGNTNCKALFDYNDQGSINLLFIPNAGQLLNNVTVNDMNIGPVYHLRIRSTTHYVDVAAGFSVF